MNRKIRRIIIPCEVYTSARWLVLSFALQIHKAVLFRFIRLSLIFFLLKLPFWCFKVLLQVLYLMVFILDNYLEIIIALFQPLTLFIDWCFLFLKIMYHCLDLCLQILYLTPLLLLNTLYLTLLLASILLQLLLQLLNLTLQFVSFID